jgi:hypothetical protein
VACSHQDLTPDPSSFDLGYLSNCLRIITDLMLNSPAERDTLADDHLDFAEDLLNGVIAFHAVALSGADEMNQGGSDGCLR